MASQLGIVNRIFVKRTRRGQVKTHVRQHYLRDDLPTGSPHLDDPGLEPKLTGEQAHMRMHAEQRGATRLRILRCIETCVYHATECFMRHATAIDSLGCTAVQLPRCAIGTD